MKYGTTLGLMPALAGLVLAGLTGCSSNATVSTVASKGPSSTPRASSATPSPTPSPSPTFNGKTSCKKVLYIGESTSIGMVSALQVPDAAERLEGRMKQVGVEQLSVNISGGRSTFERLLGRPNTLDVLTPELTAKFDGCYFLALGTNDAADSALLHSHSQIVLRIDTIMKRIGNHPVLWPTLRTAPTARQWYKDIYMQEFDAELRTATQRYPNLRLYDWRTEMNPAWFEADNIHDRRIGSRERALMFARALAVAFPDKLPPNPDPIVGSQWGKPPSPANEPTLTPMKYDQQPFWAGDTEALDVYKSGPEPD